jgi:K+-transporting ATPase ATPase A chain
MFFGANAAHPFENPSGVSNVLQMAVMGALGFGAVFALGRMADVRPEARALVLVMGLFLTVAALAAYAAETQPTPAPTAVHLRAAPNLEGKETRFGSAGSAAYAIIGAGSSTGSTNAALESFTPMAGGVALFMMELGQIAPGGAGSGLYGIVNIALLAVFVAGLLVGRTPEYLGKRIEAREIRLVMLAVLAVSASSLGLTAIAAVLPGALARLSSAGPHGLTELLWTYTSATANNGSAFAGIRPDTPYLNITLALAMAVGRYGVIVPVIALCGALAAKPRLSLTSGVFPTDGAAFVCLLSVIIIIMAGLQFFPAQALGPIVEQLEMARAVAGRRGP